MPRKADFTTLQFVLIVLGIVAWVIAAFFGLNDTISTGRGTREANITAAGAALGFALAGAACFVAAAIGDRGRGSQPPSGQS
jgi:hypothetical protein